MTVAAWIESLQKFDAALDVLVRVNSDEHDIIYTALKPCFAVDAGCTETDMLVIDMVDGDEGVDEVLALGPPDDSDYEVNPDDPQGILRADRDAEVDALKFGLCHDGEFDETFVRNAFVHIERMNETGLWIGIDGAEGQRLMVNTGVYRGEWYFNVEEDAVDGKNFSVRRPRSSKTELPRKQGDPRRHCAIVGEADLEKLVVKYLGGGKGNISNDEREILLFALYSESIAREGLAKRGLDAMDARLKAQNERAK